MGPFPNFPPFILQQTCADYISTMKLFLLLSLLLSTVYGSNALAAGEIVALEKLLATFPALQAQTPPWSANTTLACEPPGFYGLTCSEGPDRHILKLYGPFFDRLKGQVPFALRLPCYLQSLVFLTQLIIF